MDEPETPLERRLTAIETALEQVRWLVIFAIVIGVLHHWLRH